jgi:hypothetical protein
VKTATDTASALYARGPVPERLAAIARRLGDLPARDARTVGVAFAFGDALASAECFASNSILRLAWPKLLAAAAAEEAARPGTGAAESPVPNSRPGVNLLLESALRGEWIPSPENHSTLVARRTRAGDLLDGEASLPGGRLGHAALYIGAPTPADATAYALDANKALRLAADLARAMASAPPARRALAIREIGSLPWAQAAETLAAYVGIEADETVRVALAEALGATRNPGAVKPLIDLLDKSKRGGPAARAAALALARTADPRAIPPLFKLLHQADIASARTGLDACAVFLAGLRDRAALERAMARFVSFFESLDSHILETDLAAAVCAGHPIYQALYEPMRAAISGIAGIPIASGAHARQWWNRNREAFLRSRETLK